MVGHFGASLVLPSCHGSMPPKKIPPRHSDTMDLNFNDKNKTWPKFEEPSVYFSSIYLVLLFWRTFYWSVFFFKIVFICVLLLAYCICGAGFLKGYLWYREWFFTLEKGRSTSNLPLYVFCVAHVALWQSRFQMI